jgi:Zn-dependent M28 family amino/carboxypeptidase
MRTLLVFLLLCSPAFAQSAEDLRRDVTVLAADDMGGRVPSSAGMLKAQTYVVEQLKAAGFSPVSQRVQTKYGVCYNIILTIPGISLGQGIIVGAHLDHVGTDRQRRIINGADDNASGCAALIGLAKRLKNSQPRKCITFVWFTAEETGFFDGATTYVKSLRRKPDAMINLDMIGYLGKTNDKATNYNTRLDGVLDPLYKKFPFAQDITYEECPTASGSCRPDSDQYAFCSRGISSVLIHTGLHNRYHTYDDDAQYLNYAGMEKVCEYVYQLIALLAGAERKLY